MRIYFRVDGNETIGLGHLVRCISLADMLATHFSIGFVCNASNHETYKRLLIGYDIKEINSEDEIHTIAKENDIVVVDHYELTSEYQKSLKGYGITVVCIDDIGNYEFFADLIINTSPKILAVNYLSQVYTEFALGPDYALLRSQFLKAASETVKSGKSIDTAFVCFGGADNKNLTKRVVEILLDDHRFCKINIVIGSGYLFSDDLVHVINGDSRIKLFQDVNSETLIKIIRKSDLAIVPASGILTEVIAVGCNVISGTYVDNQRNFFEGYRSLSAFEPAGEFDRHDIVDAINRSFTNTCQNNKKIIDGRSSERYVRIFKQLVVKNAVRLVKCGKDDLEITFRWASDPHIRTYSFSKDKITLQSHTDWFFKKISDSLCHYYIAYFEEQAIGSIRFDIKENEAIISYLIDPVYQGNGFGGIVLKAGAFALAELKLPYVHYISGYVMANNLASRKIFERLGYSALNEKNEIKFTKRIINENRIHRN